VTLLVGGEVKLLVGPDETVELVLGAFVRVFVGEVVGMLVGWFVWTDVGLSVGVFEGELVVGRFEG